MRISTGMIFDAGVAGINRQTASLLHTQEQISSGRRILTPSEDPVAAARALEVSQAAEVVAQFKRNQDSATAALALEEVQLESANDVLARVRELAIQAGNGTLSATARMGIATELRARFDELVGLANATDANGQRMFSGYMGATTPFGGSVDGILAGTDIDYAGDDGQRKLQVSPSRFIEVSDAGSDVFMRIRNGNNYFVTDYADNAITGLPNTGTAVISAGSVLDPAAFNAEPVKDITVKFAVDAFGTVTYDLMDSSGPLIVAGRPFQSGQPILLTEPPAFDLGASVTITGAPADGDSFSIAPSSSQSVFTTIANLIGAIETPPGTPADNARYGSDIRSAIADLDQARDNILRVRASIGSRMNEVESLGDLSSNISLQHQQALSSLQDVDYATAITTLMRNQANLEAAQQSFAKVSQLSLFDYI